jgi:glycosyltransferase involved in cell wall biosynthesis
MSSKPKHRIAFVEDYLGGGIGRVIVNLGNTLLKFGVAVDVLLKDFSRSAAYLSQLHPGMRVIKLQTLHRVWGLPGIINYLRKTLVTAILTPSERLTSIAVLARKFSGSPTKVFACIHNFNINWLRATHSDSYQREYKRIRRYYPRCDRVICVSEGLRHKFIQESSLTPEKVCTIYNPILTEEMFRLAQEPVEHPWFVDHRAPIILGVGRLAEQKDFATLIKAFAEVRKTRDCRLVILGEGNQRPELEQLLDSLNVKQDVDLYGHVHNLYNFMKNADLFVLSSIHEALGNVLVEALALGTPVVSTDCPYGPAEILDYGKYGQLTPVGDHQTLASAIVKALTTPSNPDFLKTAASRFDTETITREYLNVFGIFETLRVSENP